jgi:Undecaprenyl-phosphate glucose phosphotransferase
MVIKRRNIKIFLIYLFSDLVITSLSFLLAYYIRFHSAFFEVPKGVPPFKQYYSLLPMIIVIWLFVFTLQGLYRSRRGKSHIDEFFSIMLGVVLATFILLSALLFYRVYYQFDPAVSSRYEYSRGVIAIFIIINVFTVFFGRLIIDRILSYFRKKGYNQIKILVAGAGELGRRIVDHLQQNIQWGYHVVGFLDDDPKKKKLVYNDIPVLGKLKDFKEIAEEKQVNSLFVALPLYGYKKIMALINEGNEEGVSIKLFPDIMQYITLKAEVEEIGGVPAININQTPMGGFKWAIKRTLDILFSSGFLLALTVIPLIPLIIILIKLTNRGPVFYKQVRIGMDGKRFNLYKFRSMINNAEAQTGPIFAEENDPRVTRLGWFLRYYNLDEIPQFINVIKGDMSIVGPRPERPKFVKQFKKEIPKYMLRHKVKSGITGWAQVNGWRGKTSIEKRIDFDLYYIQNWSLLFDVNIMWKTFLHWILRRPIDDAASQDK